MLNIFFYQKDWNVVKQKLVENRVTSLPLNELDALLSQGCYSFYECLLYYMKTEDLDGLELVLKVLLSMKPEELSSQFIKKQENSMYKFPEQNISDDIELLESFGIEQFTNEEQIELIWREIGTWSVQN